MPQIAKSFLVLSLVILVSFPALTRAETTPSPSSQLSALSFPQSVFSLPASRLLNLQDSRTRQLVPNVFEGSFRDARAVSRLKGISNSVYSEQNRGAFSFQQSAFSTQPDSSEWVQGSLSGDRWIGLDKLAHFLVSFSLVGIGYALSADRGIGFDRNQARLLSAGGTALIGIAKEIVDYRKGAGFSRKDLAADGLGIALGALFYTF